VLTVEVNTEKGVRRLRTAALIAADLEEPLARFGGYLRKKAIARFEAQDFPALSDATIKHRAAAGLKTLEKKLVQDLTKAKRRDQKSRAPKGLLAQIFASGAVDAAMAPDSRGVKNRTAALAEFQRLHIKRVSSKRLESGFERAMGAKPLSLKGQASLAARAGRAVARAVGQPILGNLPRTLSVLADGDTMRMVEATYGEWTEIHNRGGSAGKGAQEPKRETVVLETHDLDVLASILEDHCLAPFLEE
jgi:phage gpG-like protein